MGALAGKVEAAFAANEAREVVVPEWGLTLYVYPITLRQYSTILAPDDAVGKMLETIRVRGKNANGSPALDAADVDALLNRGTGDYGLGVVSRVAMEIMRDVPGFAITDEAVDSAEKK